MHQDLAAIPQWSIQGEPPKLMRTFSFDAFLDALSFVNRVAGLAEERNHHPDIRLSYHTVTLELWTHSAGGITEKDTALAEEIDRMC